MNPIFNIKDVNANYTSPDEKLKTGFDNIDAKIKNPNRII